MFRLIPSNSLNSNYESLQSNKKNTQTAKSSPSASGSTLAFIDTISQNAQGVITATKKNVSVANNHTTSDSGYVLDARQGKVLWDRFYVKLITASAKSIGPLVATTITISAAVTNYTVLAIRQLALTGSGGGHCCISSWTMDSTEKITVSIKNTSSSETASVTMKVQVIYYAK